MISMISRKWLMAAATAAIALQPIAASAQAPCITEDEVSAMAIYSVPTLVQAVRTRCASQLSPSGFLARRGTSFVARYTGLQTSVWPRAKSGLLKYAASKARGAQQNLQMFNSLPDNAVRPLLDALILQEASARIQPRHCAGIERVIAAAAPIEPQIAGTLIGEIIGLAAPEDQPICSARA
jgi:hypothetical protein